MAAPSDPFAHDDLHQQFRTANPNSKSNPDTWGTWEELLLASAVRKHGLDNWALISAELRSRARAGSMAFTPEACQAGYQAIRLRYGADGSREGNGLAWYEELRRLRVARLKWELEQYDNTIGSLENKLKRLQVEKEELARKKSSISHVEAQEPTTTRSSVLAGVINESIDASIVHKTEVHDDASIDRNDGPLVNQVDHNPSSAAEPTHMLRSDGSKSGVEHVSLVFAVQNGGEVPYKHMVVDETLVVNEPRQDPGGSSVKLEQAVGAEESSNMAEVLPDARLGNTDKVSSRPREQIILEKNNHGEETFAKAGHPDVLRLDDLLAKVGGFQTESKAVKAEECRNMKEEVKAIDSKKAQGGDEETERPCSAIAKSSPRKRKWSFHGAFLNSGQDNADDTRLVCKALEDKSSRESKGIVLVESGYSTEGKGQEEKVLFREPSLKKVKLERLEENISEWVPMGSLTSRKLGAAPLGYPNLDMQNHSMSSSENSLLHEVWGESVEVGEKERKPISNERRLGDQETKRMSTMKHHEGNRDRLDYSAQVESPLKLESATTSHEASESMHSPGSKDDHAEAWHHAERLSGDSRFEKSEVGSYVDGNEDNSPMSRRTRREPKVLGKHIPLLESLRVVCAHKCAPPFRHVPETEENHTYHSLIRSPIDLGMIRNKLEEGQYTGSVHFFRDLLLMVTNASVYYPRDFPESAAALSLRECIVKEMGKVFETEALVKQEGPSFRKRDSRKLNQREREGGPKAASTMAPLLKEMPAKALPMEKEKPAKASPPMEKSPNTPSLMEKPAKNLVLKHLDARTGVDSCGPIRTSVDPRARVDGGEIDKKKVYSFDGKDLEKKKFYSSDGKWASENPWSFKGSHSSKLGPAITERAGEAKHHPGSSYKATNITISKDLKKQERLAEEGSGRDRKADFASARRKRGESAMSKGVESSDLKVKVASESLQEPAKRGAGRPPKHSRQQQGKPKEEEARHSTTRKRGRR